MRAGNVRGWCLQLTATEATLIVKTSIETLMRIETTIETPMRTPTLQRLLVTRITRAAQRLRSTEEWGGVVTLYKEEE